MRTVALTGAAGQIGTVLRTGLASADTRLRLIDIRPLTSADHGEEVRTVDLRDVDDTLDALRGVDAVIHLAARAGEAPFEEIVGHNIVATERVFEAARVAGARRVVFASTAHVTGFYPWASPVAAADPVRPDTFYATSKVFGEALGRLYADKHGLQVICVRIVSFAHQPSTPAHLWGWLSPRDTVSLFGCCLDAPDIGFLVIYGVSANTRRWWSEDGWERIGYHPVDDAENFAYRFGEVTPPSRWQGGEFTRPDYGRGE